MRIINSFVSIADDSPRKVGTPPPEKKPATLAQLQYEALKQNPYIYDNDQLNLLVHAIKNNLNSEQQKQFEILYFSKGQPCLRSSPLSKSYGFGIHYDQTGLVAIYGAETETYKAFQARTDLIQTKAMRNRKI